MKYNFIFPPTLHKPSKWKCSHKGFVFCGSRGFLSTQCGCCYAVTPGDMSGCCKNYRTDNCHKWRHLRCYECWERFEVTTTLYLRIRVCQIRRPVCGLVLRLWKEGSAFMFNIKGSKKNNTNPVAKGSHDTKEATGGRSHPIRTESWS